MNWIGEAGPIWVLKQCLTVDTFAFYKTLTLNVNLSCFNIMACSLTTKIIVKINGQ